MPIGGVHRAVLEALLLCDGAVEGRAGGVCEREPGVAGGAQARLAGLGIADVKLVVLAVTARSLNGAAPGGKIDRLQNEHPDDYITVVLPEFVPKRWWHHLAAQPERAGAEDRAPVRKRMV